MTITINDSKVLEKLDKISRIKHKKIEQIIVEIVNNYDDSQDDVDFTRKYKKLDPTKHISRFNFNEDDDNIGMTNPFKNIDNVAEYVTDIRKNAWR